jgi:hypothetical protein
MPLGGETIKSGPKSTMAGLDPAMVGFGWSMLLSVGIANKAVMARECGPPGGVFSLYQQRLSSPANAGDPISLWRKMGRPHEAGDDDFPG